MDYRKTLVAVRPFSFSASTLPVISGSLYAVVKGALFNTPIFILSVLGVLLIHIATNLANDYFDYENGIDTVETHGSSGLLVWGEVKPVSIFRGMVFASLASAVVGIIILLMVGTTAFWLGLVGIIGGLAYTAPPFNYKYHGLGVPLVFLLMGPLMVMGSYYVQARSFSMDSFLFSIPFGIFTALILLANEIRDIEHDSRKNIRSLPLFIGKKMSILLYFTIGIVAYFFVALMVFTRRSPIYSLSVFATIPVFVKNFISLKKAKSANDIASLDKQTARVQALFSLLMIFSLLIGVITS